ncbi:ABC transporter substrate-binding protein [Ekhidna sp.]|uniref:ABC transporter substrate-binding protein n=1 Tax=Ekhidna sp. TaxID=2608089 RepID=UPI0032EFC20C
MKKVRIGGVPEHFNLPIHLANEKGWFNDEGISVEWTDFPGGSGYMKDALRNNEVDLCILLTEGIISDILKGNPSKIVSGHIKTSLTWGIHAATDSASFPNIFDRKIAISRFGSGSHLMPIVHAMIENQSINPDQFIEVADVEGGIDSLKDGNADIFYWEKFTTKPYVMSGEIKKIGEFISPWPCFMIAATNKIIDLDPELVSKVLKVIHRSNEDFMKLEDAPNLVAKRYHQDLKDTERWYHSTEWSVDGWVSNKMLEGVLYSLREAKIINEEASSNGIIWKRNEQK